MSQQPQVTTVSDPVAPNGDAAYVSATTAPKSLVFKPGAVFPNAGPVQQNVYNTAGLSLLQAILGGAGLFPAIPLPSSLVELDFSANANTFAATGNLDFGAQAELAGLLNPASGAVPTLQMGANALRGPAVVTNLAITGTGAGPVIPAPMPVWSIRGLSHLSGAALFFNVPAGLSYELFVKDRSIVGDGTHPVAHVANAASLTIFLEDFAALNANAVSFAGTGTLTVFASLESTIDASFFGLPNVTIVRPVIPPGNIVIFQPGGVQVENTFTSFAALTQFIANLGGAGVEAWTIQIDISFGAATIPAGTYALPDNVTFQGLSLAGNIFPALTLADGVIFTGPGGAGTVPTEVNFVTCGVDLNNTVTPVFTCVATTQTINFKDAQLVGPGTQPLFAFNNGSTPDATLSGLNTGNASIGGNPGLSVDGTSILTLTLTNGAAINTAPNGITVAVGGQCNVFYDATCADGLFTGTTLIGTAGFTFTGTDTLNGVTVGAKTTDPAGNVTVTPVFTDYRADTTAGAVHYTLPSVATIPFDGFRWFFWLETGTGTNPFTIAVNGGAAEQIANPDTGVYQTGPISTAGSGNVQGTLLIVEWNVDKNAFTTRLGVPGSVAGARPLADANTLLDYRLNETAILPGLINHGSYGTTSAPIGPVPTTTAANFTQPNVGATVVVTYASGVNYGVGNLIFIVGGGYYLCTAAASPNFTLQNLGISGSNAAPATVIASPAAVNASGDLLVYDTDTAIQSNGYIDYATTFYGTNRGSISNYNLGGTTGGTGFFSGITKCSIHLFVKPPAYAGAKVAQIFGYSHAQAWAGTFRDIGLFFNNDSLGTWGFLLSNQTFTSSSNSPTQATGNYSAGEWNLLSVTLDTTITVGAIQFYKNGRPCGSANLSAAGTLVLGTAGYWFIGNPNQAGGDTGDGTNATIGLARFENVVRTPTQIRTMWNTLYPNAGRWPVP